MAPARQNHTRASSGLFLIIVAFFIVVVLALAALAIGGGMLLTATARAQNIANAAANAGVDALAKSVRPDGSSGTFNHWYEDALERVNQILEENSRIPGMVQKLGPISATPPYETGQLELGFYYREEPASNPDPSCVHYPCFVPVTSGVVRPNSVRVTLTSSPSNLLSMPFTQIWGSSFGNIEAVALSRVIPSCTVNLFDVSRSMAATTHDYRMPQSLCFPDEAALAGGFECNCGSPSDPDFKSGADCLNPDIDAAGSDLQPYYRITEVSAPRHALFAFRADDTIGAGCNTTKWMDLYDGAAPPAPCTALTPGTLHSNGCRDCRCVGHYQGNPDQIREMIQWCNLPVQRPTDGTTPGIHYQSDYFSVGVRLRKQSSADEYPRSFLVDQYLGTSTDPLRTALLAMNAGLRVRDEFKTQTDEALMLGFTREIVGWMNDAAGSPVPPDPFWDFDTDTERLLQVTNYNFMGLYRADRSIVTGYTPFSGVTFLSRGIFPRTGQSGANGDTPKGSDIVGAIVEAANSLAQRCSPDATKNIVLFSDGLANCSFGYAISGNAIAPGADACGGQAGHLANMNTNYSKYHYWRQNLLADGVNNITKFLADQRISLTAVLVDPDADVLVKVEDDGAGWKRSAEQILQQGGDAFLTEPMLPDDTSGFEQWRDFECVPSVMNPSAYEPDLCTPEHYAYDHHGEPDTAFRDAIDLWSRVAVRTAGSVCPLRRRCYEIPGSPCIASESAGGCYFDHDDEPSTPGRLKSEYFSDPALTETGSTGEIYLRCSDIDQSIAEQAVACVMNALGFAPYQSVSAVD